MQSSTWHLIRSGRVIPAFTLRSAAEHLDDRRNTKQRSAGLIAITL